MERRTADDRKQVAPVQRHQIRLPEFEALENQRQSAVNCRALAIWADVEDRMEPCPGPNAERLVLDGDSFAQRERPIASHFDGIAVAGHLDSLGQRVQLLL